MYPTTAEPHFGCFVRDQVDDLRGLGADVTVLAFDGRGHRRRYAGAARRLRRALRRGRYDVVHAHYGLSGAVAAMQLRRARRDDVPRERRMGAVAAAGVVARGAADAADRRRPGDRGEPGRPRRAGDPVRRRPRAVLAGRPRRGPARPGLAAGRPVRALPRGPQRPRQGRQQARRRVRRDGASGCAGALPARSRRASTACPGPRSPWR